MNVLYVILTAALLVVQTADPSAAGSLTAEIAALLCPNTDAGSEDGHEVNPDKATRECVACHDGLVAPEVRLMNARNPALLSGFGGGNHPVGVSYDQHVRKDPDGLNGRSFLNPSIRLADGKVTCISCHRLKQDTVAQMSGKEKDFCTASNELTGRTMSDLCLSCHRM